MDDKRNVPPSSCRKRQPSLESTGFSPNVKQRQAEAQSFFWSQLEDDLLCYFVEEAGGKENVSWPKCANYILEHAQSHRSGPACRKRFNTHNSRMSQPRPIIEPGKSEELPESSTKVTCGMQTEISFAPGDQITWTVSHKKTTDRSIITQTPSLRSLLISPTEIANETSTHVVTSAPGDSTLRQNSLTRKRVARKLVMTDNKESIVQDHLYTKSKLPSQRSVKVPEVKPHIQDLATAMTQETIAPSLTQKEKARLILSMSEVQSTDEVAVAALEIPSLHSAIVEALSKDVGSRPDKMNNQKHGFVSVLMRKDYDAMKENALIDIVDEFKTQFPEVFKLIFAIMHKRKEISGTSCVPLVPRLALLYGILMQTRNPSLSRIQRILTMVLADQICDQKVYDRLNTVGVTLSYTSALDVTKIVGGHFKDEILSAIKDKKSMRLIGDNLNFMQGVAHETIDKHDHMRHMFASCALVNEEVYGDRPDTPQIPLREMTLKDVSLSQEEYRTLRDGFVVIVAEVIKKYIPQLQFIMESSAKHVGPQHEEFSHKTKVIPLPVLDLNEQYEKYTVEILDFYEELVKDLPVEKRTHVGGDQLTRERFNSAIDLRIGNPRPAARYAHLGPVTCEFFHLGMNYLDKVVFNTLWSKTGEEDLGTLRGEKERIIRNSVNPKVPEAYDADKQFFVSYVSAYVVEAALDFFGIEDRNDSPTKNVPPCNATPEEKKTWLAQTLGVLVDEYAFPYWTGNDKETFTECEINNEPQTCFVKLSSGEMKSFKVHQRNASLKPVPEDKKKIYAHYVLEVGLTYIYFLRICKSPDRERLLALFKMMMVQLKGRNTKAKYPLELLNLLFQQYSILSERRAHQVLHDCFVNTKGKNGCNVPADLQMEWQVRENKRHIKHMLANKTVNNITTKSAALPGLHAIASNFDEDAEVVVRSKAHSCKDRDKDEVLMMDDLRRVKPFQLQPGRKYQQPKFSYLKTSQAKNLARKKFRKWFTKHKGIRLANPNVLF